MIKMDILAVLVIGVNVIVSLSWFLQAHKIVKRKSSKDISIPFIAVVCIGLVFFALYAWREQDFVMFIPFIIGLMGVSAVLVTSLMYRKKVKK